MLRNALYALATVAFVAAIAIKGYSIYNNHYGITSIDLGHGSTMTFRRTSGAPTGVDIECSDGTAYTLREDDVGVTISCGNLGSGAPTPP